MSEVLIRRFLLVSLLVLGVFLATITRQSAPTLPGEFSARVAPLFGWSFRTGQNLQSALSAIFDRRDLRALVRDVNAEIEALKQENQRLTLENRQLQSTLRVQKLLGLGVVTVAPVLEADASGLYHRLVLGAGANQGLRVGMPATNANRLVGVVTEVTANTAIVRTLLDPESAVAVRMANTPGLGTAYGSPPRSLRMEIAPEASVNPGDQVVTGSLQGLYPAGITVGTVDKVLPAPLGALRKTVMVRPAVQFSLIEEVQILKPL